ncbi:Voltage-dependent T-type calcium channel subunit alpha-1H, partial [Durusdinium trenchii]
EDELAKLLGVYDYVKGIGPLMQLLIQFLTLDSWNSKMDQIIPYANGCIIYFYMYIAVAVFVLMNLVTAIIVENAMSTSKMDENEKLKQMEDIKKKELKELEHLFYLMDADGMARLTGKRFLTKSGGCHRFENAFLDEEMSRKWRLLDFGPDECKELFDLLDDGDGGIHTSEFFHGLARMKGGAQSRDLMRVGQQVDRIGKELDKLIEAWKTERRSNQIDSATASELGS